MTRNAENPTPNSESRTGRRGTLDVLRSLLDVRSLFWLAKMLLRFGVNVAISPRTVWSLGEPFFWGTGRRFKKCSNVADVRRVLVVRLDAIGDMVLTTPFLRELRRALPEACITLVVARKTFNLVEFCPYVNEVLALAPPAPGQLLELRRLCGALNLAATHLWHRRFDVAFVPRWDVDHYAASFVAYFSGAGSRIGYSEKTTKLKSTLNRGYDLLYSRVFKNALPKHEVMHNLGLLDYVGLAPKDSTLELWTSDEDNAAVQQWLQPIESEHHDALVALALGTTEPKKTWPLSRYIQVSKWLRERGNICLILIGGAGEVELGERYIKEVPSAVDLIGKLSLRQTAELLRRCHLYVGNDTGPMHLAAAVGTPVVEISCRPLSGDLNHYTSPERFGPWDVTHRVLQPAKARDDCKEGCRASEAHCILGVDVEAVQQAILALLGPHLQREQRKKSRARRRTTDVQFSGIRSIWR